jgi:twitching motility protein PilT
MVVTPGIRNLTRERKTHLIYSLIEGGGEIGMHTFDQRLLLLHTEARISVEEALAKANHPDEPRARARIERG